MELAALAIIGVVAGVVFLIAQVPLVITPIVVAAVIAASVAPLAEALQRRGWSAAVPRPWWGGTFLLLLS